MGKGAGMSEFGFDGCARKVAGLRSVVRAAMPTPLPLEWDGTVGGMHGVWTRRVLKPDHGKQKGDRDEEHGASPGRGTCRRGTGPRSGPRPASGARRTRGADRRRGRLSLLGWLFLAQPLAKVLSFRREIAPWETFNIRKCWTPQRTFAQKRLVADRLQSRVMETWCDAILAIPEHGYTRCGH